MTNEKNVVSYRQYIPISNRTGGTTITKKRKWGRVLAFGAITAALGGIAAYKHRKEIERTLQEIADQMDAWEESSEFFTDQDTVVHTVNPAPEGVEEAPAAENEPAESDFVDAAPAETEEKPSTAE